MTRYIASALFKDEEGNVMPFLFKYNAPDSIPAEETFEEVKKYIETRKDVTYVVGVPQPCYLDRRYSDAYKVIDQDYSFLFRGGSNDKTKH